MAAPLFDHSASFANAKTSITNDSFEVQVVYEGQKRSFFVSTPSAFENPHMSTIGGKACDPGVYFHLIEDEVKYVGITGRGLLQRQYEHFRQLDSKKSQSTLESTEIVDFFSEKSVNKVDVYCFRCDVCVAAYLELWFLSRFTFDWNTIHAKKDLGTLDRNQLLEIFRLQFTDPDFEFPKPPGNHLAQIISYVVVEYNEEDVGSRSNPTTGAIGGKMNKKFLKG